MTNEAVGPRRLQELSHGERSRSGSRSAARIGGRAFSPFARGTGCSGSDRARPAQLADSDGPALSEVDYHELFRHSMGVLRVSGWIEKANPARGPGILRRWRRRTHAASSLFDDFRAKSDVGLIVLIGRPRLR
jgi:hypothetical protein